MYMGCIEYVCKQKQRDFKYMFRTESISKAQTTQRNAQAGQSSVCFDLVAVTVVLIYSYIRSVWHTNTSDNSTYIT